MRSFAWIVLVTAIACASKPPPLAPGPIDWRAADERWSIHVVTTDADGDERVTRVWLAIADGQGTIRTQDSRWWRNLERDANCRIRLLGIDYPVHAEFVTEHQERVAIDEAFIEKYGWLERTLFRQERGETHENYARLHRGEAP